MYESQKLSEGGPASPAFQRHERLFGHRDDFVTGTSSPLRGPMLVCVVSVCRRVLVLLSLLPGGVEGEGGERGEGENGGGKLPANEAQGPQIMDIGPRYICRPRMYSRYTLPLDSPRSFSCSATAVRVEISTHARPTT